MSDTEQVTFEENDAMEAKPHEPETKLESTGHERHYTEDRDYLEILRDMQQGQWERVIPMLRALQARYPHAHELDTLIQEATFRSNMESNWGDKVKGVQGFNLPIRSLMPVIPILILAVLLVAGVMYYGRIQRVNALSDQQRELLQQAQSSLTGGQYREALDLFDQVLAENPGDEEALKGQSETKRQMKLANDYQLALDRIAASNYKQALDLLTALQSQAPGYRDVAARIEEVQSNMGAPQLWADAEFAYANNLWLTAIVQYEELSKLNSEYEAEQVQAHLATSYLKAGQQMVAVRPSDSMAPKQVQDYFRKAQQLGLNDASLKLENELLDNYVNGERLVSQNNYEEGAKRLLEIYDQRPDYFGGYVAELLYRAFVGIGERYVQSGQLKEAQAIYQRALDLGVDSNGVAQQQLQTINKLLAPPPPPVAANTGNDGAAAVVAQPTPVSWQDQFRGWIAFRSNRDGGEAIYLMKGDGSEQQQAPSEVIYNLAKAYQQQQWSADGTQFVYVEHVSDQASTNIFKVRADLPATWDRDTMLTDYTGTEYDPVWSPDGHWIAFVANHTGNDEIWSMDWDGNNQRQLTFNDWPWDKHPTFSPDGTEIAFYSNRSGARQIWTMNADGSGQVNISNNSYEDWDPVWIR
ncbi:MAG: hypothetical protein R3C14_14695 [Caldilineaceae bacterium]